jgi:hypothetical protein
MDLSWSSSLRRVRKISITNPNLVTMSVFPPFFGGLIGNVTLSLAELRRPAGPGGVAGRAASAWPGPAGATTSGPRGALRAIPSQIEAAGAGPASLSDSDEEVVRQHFRS